MSRKEIGKPGRIGSPNLVITILEAKLILVGQIYLQKRKRLILPIRKERNT